MKSFSITALPFEVEMACQQILAINPTFVLVFAAPPLLRDGLTFSKISESLNGVPFIGCSTAGEISSKGVTEGSVSFFAIQFNNTKVRTTHEPLAKAEDSRAVGMLVAEQLNAPDLKGIFLFCPGTHINGSGVVDGLATVLPPHVVIAGGLAGDEMDFKKTHTLCNGEIFNDHIVAIGLYGEHVVLSCGSEGGWRPFGPARQVTKSEKHILYELDGKPALQLYKQYLGERAKQLPGSGLSYPFAILRADKTTSGLIRSALAIDHETEALVLAGDIPPSCKVCLMHADTAALAQGAAQAAAEALRIHAGSEENGCALVVSCVGRRAVLGIDVDDEIEAIVDSFLPDTPIGGYYAYGEICSYRRTGRVELHNQTMTITYITEGEEKV